jgi:hypothetical protein
MSEVSQLDQLVRTGYPFPISHAYAYMTGRVAPGERYQASIACFEVTLKYIASLALANFFRDAQEDPGIGNAYLFQDLIDRLDKPVALGHWQDVLHLTLRPYATRRDKLVVPELFDFYYRVTETGKVRAQGDAVQLLQRFIQERNEDAHHRNRAQVSLTERQEKQANVEHDLLDLLDRLRFLADYELFYVEQAEFRDGCWHYRANSACGSEYPFPQGTWKTTDGVDSYRCFLSARSGPAILDLYPFLIVTSEGHLPHEDMFFFDGVFSSGQANFLSYHANVYIDQPADESSPASVASDAINSLLSFLQRQIPKEEEPERSMAEIYGQAVRWAWEHGQRQSISFEALRQMLDLSREEALQQERALEEAQGIEVEPEAEIPFEGTPSWANLAYYVLESSGQEEMSYREIAAEAAQLRDQHDPNWALGDSANVDASISNALSQDPRFYKIRRGYYRLTKHSELLSNPSWANLAYFVLKHRSAGNKGMHVQEITDRAIELKEKYSDWRRGRSQTPANTVSATMSVDHRFEPLPERGHWRLAMEAAAPEGAVSEAPAATIAPHPPARSEVYAGVLARLAGLGALAPLPFGRTYYALDGRAHLMFRFSREHRRSGEIEYFMGVTPQYFERIRRLGSGFMVLVLGGPDNVLIVPAETFAGWVEGIEPSGSGTWPLAFYQPESKDRTERWVLGAGREEVSALLNDYDPIRRALAPAPKTGTRQRRSSLPRLPALLAAGLVRPGDTVMVQGHPDETATVVDAKRVDYGGERRTYTEWGKQVTGWTAINIYPWVVLVRTGQTLGELRDALSQQGDPVHKEPPPPKRRGYRRHE